MVQLRDGEGGVGRENFSRGLIISNYLRTCLEGLPHACAIMRCVGKIHF